MLAVIAPNSVAALILAKSMEDSAGIRRAHLDAREHQCRRHEAGEPNVEFWGLSASYSMHRRMKPIETVVQKRAQGSSDDESAWCQACMGWVTQLLLRIQAKIPPEWGGPLTEEEMNHRWFQVSNLTCFSPYQVVEWDETHQDLVMLGGSGRSRRGKEVQVRYHRMPDGTIDMTGGQQPGSTLAEQRNRLSVKFDDNVRFLLGIACVRLKEGTLEGRRAAALEYTNCVVLTDKDFWLRIWTEVARVKTLSGDGAPWVTGHRTDEDGIFDEDQITKLSRAGQKTAAILAQHDIYLVEDVACLVDEDIPTLVEPRLSEARLQ